MGTIYVGDLGPDGKYSVTYTGHTSDPGETRRIRRSRDELIMENHRHHIIGIYIDPMEWPETMNPEDIEEYEPS